MSDVEPEICNCAALRQAARRVTRFYDEALAPTGLGVNQFSILARLSRVGPSTIQDLARLLVMDRSTLGHLLRPLEKRGLVKLDVSEQDRRSCIVALTPAGKAAVAKARSRWAAAQRRFESAFGKDAAVELRAVLKEIATAEFRLGHCDEHPGFHQEHSAAPPQRMKRGYPNEGKRHASAARRA